MGLNRRGMMIRGAGLVLGGWMAVVALAGCTSGTTETGYEPNKLGLSDAQRKGLYAPKYSQQQARAQAEQEAENKARKPTMFQ
jgi:hypothetical protein